MTRIETQTEWWCDGCERQISGVKLWELSCKDRALIPDSDRNAILDCEYHFCNLKCAGEWLEKINKDRAKRK